MNPPLLALFCAALLLACSSEPPANDGGDAPGADSRGDAPGADSRGDAGHDDDADDAITDDNDLADPLADMGEDTMPSRCWTDLEIGDSEIFYDGFEGGSEGIAFGADGRLYVTSLGTVWALDADATPTAFAEVPAALGIAPTDDGFVVASIGLSTNPADIDGAVYHVALDGDATLLVDGIASPNFVTMMPDGSALISDDFDTRVFRVTRDGDVSVAIDGIASPNGMAYSPDGAWLYVASTFTPTSQLTRIPVDAAGIPATDRWEEVAELGSGATSDGLAIDIDGNVYVAANLRNELVRVPADGADWSVIASRLGTPASLAFGRGDGFDPCSVYITQLFGTRILRVAIGAEGAPLLPFD